MDNTARIDEIINSLSKLDFFVKSNGNSENTILSAEEKLGVKFSPQYRYFLKNYGYISGYGYEIDGIIKDNIDGQGVVKSTIQNRWEEKFNRKWISFQNLSGEEVSFDYNRINEEGEPMVFYNSFYEQREDAAEDFVSYLEKMYEEMKEW